MSGKFTAVEIANFYIQLLNSIPDNSIDNLKINKLLYYVQGWSLVRLGHPMFDDEIQAWDYGPVIPTVYHIYKCCGKSPIEEPSEAFDEKRLSPKELELLIDVYTQYGRYTGWALKDMTHVKGGPWDQAYRPKANCRIDLNTMKDYFLGQEMPTFEVDMTKLDIVKAVPASWDTEEDCAIYG